MIFRFAPNRYVITAAVIGMAGSGISIALLMRAQRRVLEKPYCSQALELLERNDLVTDLIGKPIKINRPDLIDKSQQFGALFTDIRVPFEGANKSGNLHIEADRPTTEDEWSVRKLSIRFANVPEKLLIVYRRKEEEVSKAAVEQQDNTDETTATAGNAERRKHEWL
ncbi:hypothetical protein TYRP_006640 [Tyrophagus putrescentiae]|nr:hypothetical protein TYRP_006640 [Tyrophagus putrescentiae]